MHFVMHLRKAQAPPVGAEGKPHSIEDVLNAFAIPSYVMHLRKAQAPPVGAEGKSHSIEDV